MTEDRIEAVLKRVRAWPRARQEDAARILLAMEAEDLSVYSLSDEERADLEAALDEVARGEVASEAEVVRTFARLRG